MIVLEAALLTCLVVIGGLCAISDFRQGIIPNKMIFGGFAISSVIHILLLIFEMAPYYPTWLYNMVIADLLAFIMFYIKLWAAGDAKLFMMCYFCLPPRLFDQGVLTYSITPYIFIFLPALIWIVFDSLVRWIKKEPRKAQPFHWKKWGLNCLVIMAEVTALYSLLLCFAEPFLSEHSMFVTFLMMAYAFFCGSVSFMKKWYVLVIHILIFAVTCILGKWSITIPDWKNLAIIIGVLLLQRVAGMYNYQLIKTNTIKKGMIPAAETVLQFNLSRVKSLPTDASEELTAKISEEEEEAIRRWESSAKGQDEIWIVRKVPFAFLIVLGFVLWTAIRLVGVR